MSKATKANPDIDQIYAAFNAEFEPLEPATNLLLLTDNRTGAKYCECHVKASKLVELSTVDVPLDPDDQADYRANREIVEDAYAFQRMKEDAIAHRSFSNIVAEFTKDFDAEHPLKIIGGQHRFEALRQAFGADVNEYHGIKVYFGLTLDQRLDVQLISNTNIATSGDLFDRMHETAKGPELRNWCQSVGLLGKSEDFADRRERNGPISVQIARTFITNYFFGGEIDPEKFDNLETTPILCPTGRHDLAWDNLKSKKPGLWTDAKLSEAGKEFARLVAAQRNSFAKGQQKNPPDYPEKTMNLALLAAWAYVAGILKDNDVRLKRHYALADSTGRDPLNANALAKGRHKTDPDNYRGLGYRTDPKERGRFVELFFLQAGDGKGITPNAIDVAIKKYHAKQALLEVQKAQSKG